MGAPTRRHDVRVTLYASRPARIVRQVVFDVIAVAIVVGAWNAGTTVHDTIQQYTVIGESVAESADSIEGSLASMGDSLADVGFDAGIFEWSMPDSVTSPFYDAAETMADIEQAGNDGADAVGATAQTSRWAIAGIPAVLVIALWALVRGRWIANAGVLKRLARTPEGRESLAMRAAVNAKPRALADVGVSPLRALRDGDSEAIDALAGVEMRREGLRLPAS